LAWAIVHALTDQQAAAERTERAMTYLETSLAWPVIARMTLDVYHEVLEAHEV
jgi:hypothetical protein